MTCRRLTMSENVWGTAAAAWGVVMAVSPALQLLRMARTRSSEDVSIGYFALLVPGFLLWVAYGVVSGDPFIAFPNVVAALTASVLIAYAVALRRRSADDGS
jgi:MtN3 and saliva related transmembrane protein